MSAAGQGRRSVGPAAAAPSSPESVASTWTASVVPSGFWKSGRR
ncbi:MAG: hypothetical protein ACNA8W_23075 [Bradymonadaceae bacterium]